MENIKDNYRALFEPAFKSLDRCIDQHNCPKFREDLQYLRTSINTCVDLYADAPTRSMCVEVSRCIGSANNLLSCVVYNLVRRITQQLNTDNLSTINADRLASDMLTVETIVRAAESLIKSAQYITYFIRIVPATNGDRLFMLGNPQ